MYVFRLTVLPTAPNTWVTSTRVLESGYLTAISATSDGGRYGSQNDFLEVGLMDGGIGETLIVATLFSDYVGEQTAALWTGRIPMRPALNLYARMKRIHVGRTWIIAGVVDQDP